MRVFINAMLAFALVGVAAGLIPITAKEMARVHAMQSEFADAPEAQLVTLRPSFTR